MLPPSPRPEGRGREEGGGARGGTGRVVRLSLPYASSLGEGKEAGGDANGKQANGGKHFGHPKQKPEGVKRGDTMGVHVDALLKPTEHSV